MNEQPWIIVEKVRNVTEAALLCNALRNAGIEAITRGEHRPSIAGELPFMEALVDVCVTEADVSRAREVLAGLRNTEEGTPRRCVKCNEESPGTFAECWNC